MASYFTILGMDPGMTNLGWAYARTCFETNIMEVLDYGKITASKVARKDKVHRSILTTSTLSAVHLDPIYKDLVLEHQANYHATEDAFYHPRRPNAFLSLSLCIHTCERALYELHMRDLISTPQCQLWRFAPQQIKKIFSTTGKSSKGDMGITLQSFVDKGDIVLPEYDGEELSEHIIDAIACCYAMSELVLQKIEPEALIAVL